MSEKAACSTLSSSILSPTNCHRHGIYILGLEKDTVLYLAYGSNLAYETFQGSRGIKPLAQVNVLVPELRMTFDLPGIPYVEPCFANTALRATPEAQDENQGFLEKSNVPGKEDYHKDRWKKGLVGVVYEVTPSDYAHIIATEGGGAAYKDILVTCFPLEAGSSTVPEQPITAPFKAHTLFAPQTTPPESGNLRVGNRLTRPDPSYAQASARYLKLITDGGREHAFPAEYLEYLDDIRPYTITTRRQRIGEYAFLMLWGPFLLFMFALMERFQDKKTGKIPTWLASLQGAIFGAVWKSYDGYFKRMFGDGERTIGDEAFEGRSQAGRTGEARV
ncbi:hypothetical protein NA57DRAFT_65976 [Rhizodiscina lignyota]|uniref:gamma-glutamylcyclotransferase n=1 Tax=Rhizodiscina lignyota TaxID=1504668 RepID=A0A9P4MAA0_9PEZI|nr:hypothetical protein NA57DRAFT_65976 [Rhizodiscina lignyota]